MHLRRTTVKRNGKTYKYAQLVESFRRSEDGMPMKKVVANLGRLSDDEFNNLKTALDASRAGKSVVAASVRNAPAKPQANLDYLDVAVLLELWRHLHVDRILSEVLPEGDSDVHPADVVAALAIHRCVDPGSKLHATRWFPRTALPELLDIEAGAFGNSRLHRVLEQVANETDAIMRSLPALYLGHDQTESFSALYVDISDATFEGTGPDIACQGRAKDNTIRQRIGIVLVCNDRGFPLRWGIVAGNASEAPVLIEQMRLAAGTSWGKRTPIVADRAVGKTAYLRELLAARVHFVTAMTRLEFHAYAPDLSTCSAGGRDGQGVAQALEEQEGFTRVDDTLLWRDLGVITHDDSQHHDSKELTLEDVCQDALRRAKSIVGAVATGAAASNNEAAKNLGYEPGTAKFWMKLLKLTPELQEMVLAGAAFGLPMRRLIAIGKLSHDVQRAAFDQLVELREAGKLRKPTAKPNKRTSNTREHSAVRVRAVVYFNPNMFEHQRNKAKQKLDKLNAFVEELNAKLTSSGRVKTDPFAAVEQKLRRMSLVNAFDISTSTAEVGKRTVKQVKVDLKQAEWQRRRALDGFSLLVAHPDIAMDAAGLCRLYRNKDAVEKDFQTIKSVLQMLPVRHHTDQKVLAHVTICALALLLERLLRDRLDGLVSAEQALESLASCHLNRYGNTPANRAYLVTEPDDDQRKILRALNLRQLTSDTQMIETIHPK